MKLLMLPAVVLGSAVLLGACGGGSNNDQGISFSLVGYNSLDDEGACEPDIFVSGTQVFISGGGSTEQVPASENVLCLSMQNNMSTQGVRVDRFISEFSVVGSALQPPTTSRALGFVLGANIPTQNAPGQQIIQSTLPIGFGRGSQATAGFSVLPVEVREWIIFNRNSLPPVPFNMTLNGRLIGITTAGDVLESNALSLSITVLEDNIIVGGPSEGDEDDADAGFTDESFSEDSSEFTSEGGDFGGDSGADAGAAEPDLEVQL